MRWLHCSDLHFGKDRTAQERLLQKILEHIEDRVSRGFAPDLVFVTGDLADRVLPSQYDGLRSEFVKPLLKALGGDGERWAGSILAVPGNHDVDRTKHQGFDREKAIAPGTRYFDPS